MITPMTLAILLLALQVIGVVATLRSLGKVSRHGEQYMDVTHSFKVICTFFIVVIGTAYYSVVTTFGGVTGYLIIVLWLSSVLPTITKILFAGRRAVIESKETLYASLWISLSQTILLTILIASNY